MAVLCPIRRPPPASPRGTEGTAAAPGSPGGSGEIPPRSVPRRRAAPKTQKPHGDGRKRGGGGTQSLGCVRGHRETGEHGRVKRDREGRQEGPEGPQL